MTIVRVQKDMIDRKALMRSQQDGEHGFVRSGHVRLCLHGWRVERCKQVKWYHQRVLELREQFQDPELHPRTAPAMAASWLRLNCLSSLPTSPDAINDVQANDYLEKFEKALKNLMQAQNLGRAAMQPAARFVRLLRDALASGRCHITLRTGRLRPPIGRGLRLEGVESAGDSLKGTVRPGRGTYYHRRLCARLATGSSGPAIGWIDGQARRSVSQPERVHGGGSKTISGYATAISASGSAICINTCSRTVSWCGTRKPRTKRRTAILSPYARGI